MVSESGHTPDRVETLAYAQEHPREYQLFQFLRLLECLNADKPRLGYAHRPVDEPVRVNQPPSLLFAPSEVESIEVDAAGRAKVAIHSFGLFGPNGALPIHLSEYAWDRQHNYRDSSFSGFADVFHHRMALLFYRAWATSQPTVAADRPDDDRFSRFVGAMAGYGMASLRERDVVDDPAKLFYAGLLSRNVRNADCLQQILRNDLGVEVEIEQFKFHWMEIPPDQRTMLGRPGPQNALGQGTLIGSRVPDCQHAVGITLGPMSLARYRQFLPGSPSLQRLLDWLRNYAGFEFRWDVRLKLAKPEVPALKLGRGGGQLGWTTWLGHYNRPEDPADMAMTLELAVD
ncbi:type VI secretion system baseplate subunit TssG [Parachitinimonas caeni]|uniref:Type VI secretion system baseplate subunit TssG n=1 Tax=Parachitinimonas caeni TaxID=3031301 RepID=A0ABT7E2L4_9NEIS|nr:type VI secretion system baseplate subunit TssG [Parachitinimonas caeni]MDK2126559.1 type VI secretion system baseplate subunit TssG [Parachitinimonas caeni]